MRHILSGLAALLLAAGLALAGGASTAGGAGSSAAFDWSMPPRTGLDQNNDGVIDVRDTPAKVQPSAFRLNLNACGSIGQIVTYRWRIDGAASGDFGACNGFSPSLAEGTYMVELDVIDADGDTATVAREVVVQDFLVVALGDSYASGEGNPDIPILGGAFDDYRDALNALDRKADDLADVQAEYDRTTAQAAVVDTALDRVREAVANEARYCNPFSGEADFDLCLVWGGILATQTVTLTTELAELGLAALIDTPGAISEALDDAVAAALSVRDAAQALVDDARETIENAEAALNPVWQDRQCHRSANAGQARAAKAIEDADPRTSVTLVHLSCSGAQVDIGLLGPFDGPEGQFGPDNDPQVDEAAFLIGNREVDALLLSIGGNNIGFGPVVEACITQDPCHNPPTSVDVGVNILFDQICGPFVLFPEISNSCLRYFNGSFPAKSALEIFNDNAPIMPGLYEDADAGLDASFPAVARDPGRVLITEYPNALEDESGNPCQTDLLDPLQNVPGLSPEEATWLRDVLTVGLNDAVEAGAAAHDWTYVGGTGGIFDQFSGHGYCSDNGWFVRFQDTFSRQGEYHGVVHPTGGGLTVYRNALRDAMSSLLYEGGDISAPRRPQQPPVADINGPYALDEGSTIQLENESFDRDGDALSFTWDVQTIPPGAASINDVRAERPFLTGIDDTSNARVGLEVRDGYGGLDTDGSTLTVRNVAPAAEVGAATATLTEGGSLSRTVVITDPGTNDTHTATASWGDGTAVENLTVAARSASASHVYRESGSFTGSFTVTDDDSGVGNDAVAVTVQNAPATIGPIALPIDPLPIGSTVSPTATFSDPGVDDTHTATWSWDDGSTSSASVTETAGVGTASGSHTFSAAGVYEVRLTVTDDEGASATRTFQFVVVYDPSGGFVTGAGSIDSPAGAYLSSPTAEGRGRFGFVSKYQKGTTVPTGRTDFEFETGALSFESNTYQWLVVSGSSKAQFKGSGKLDGLPGYGFLLTAYDGGLGGVDRFRIKIWSIATSVVVYDNRRGTSDDIDSASPPAIASGQIVVHRTK